MNEIQYEKIRKIIEHYGVENQRAILQEECAELIQAISKVNRVDCPENNNHMIEEMADVLIVINQIISTFSYEQLTTLYTIQDMKINRQIGRIEKGE